MSTTDEQPPTPPDEGEGLDVTTELPTSLAGHIRLFSRWDGGKVWLARLKVAALDHAFEFEREWLRASSCHKAPEHKGVFKTWRLPRLDDGVYEVETFYDEGGQWQRRRVYFEVQGHQVRRWSLKHSAARGWLTQYSRPKGVPSDSNDILVRLREIASDPHPNPNPDLEALKRLLLLAKDEGEDTWVVASDYLVAGFKQYISDQLVYELHPQHQEKERGDLERGDFPALSGTQPQRVWARFLRARIYWLLHKGVGGWWDTFSEELPFPQYKGVDPEILLFALANAPRWLELGPGHDEAQWWIERKELFTSQPWTHDSLVKLLLWTMGRFAPHTLNDRGTRWIRPDQVRGGRLVEWFGAEDRFS